MSRPATTTHRSGRRAAVTGLTLVGLAVLVGLAGCGTAQEQRAATAAGYPVTVTNCGAEVTFDEPPSRVLMLTSSSVPFLHELGVMDRVVARAGQYPDDYYDDATRAELADVPLLTDELDTSGHLQISREEVVAQQPDLVVGSVDNISRETLAAVDVPLLEEPALCPEGLDQPGFDDVWSQLETYGEVFGREEQAREAVTRLRERTGRLEEGADDTGRTAAVLYPTVGGGTTYAYGTRSMAHPQLEAAGLDNVFADVDERVFEVTVEELLGRDPDVLVLLHSEGDGAGVEEAVRSLPGAERLSALRDGEVMTQLFNFTEPPTPLTIEGLERIVERFGDAR